MLKLATKEDSSYIKEMCLKFLMFSPYSRLDCDITKIDTAILALVEDPDKSVVILGIPEQDKPCGMLGMSLNSLPFNDAKVATEIAWWMDEEHRKTRLSLEMFKAAEYWAKRVGASFVQFSSLSVSDPSVDKFYTRQGYEMTEKAFLKEIS